MKRALWGLLFLALTAATPAFGQVISDEGVIAPSGFTATCSQSTTFIARTSDLTNQQKTAYDTMICGMVTDGTINGNLGSTGCGSLLDVFYIYASSSSTTALLNLCGTSYTATTSGTITFSANNGFTSNGSTGFINTGYSFRSPGSTCGDGAATCHYALNSASVATYGLTSRTSDSTNISIGAFDGTNVTQILPYRVGTSNAVNQTGAFLAETNTNANGLSILTRVAASGAGALNYYHYNSSATPTTSSNAASSGNTPNRTAYVCARNNSGTADSFITDQIAAAFIGAGLTLTQANLISTRLNQFMIDVGAGYHY